MLTQLYVPHKLGGRYGYCVSGLGLKFVGHLFSYCILILLISPLIMYSKFVWSNLVWLVKCQSWLENV